MISQTISSVASKNLKIVQFEKEVFEKMLLFDMSYFYLVKLKSIYKCTGKQLIYYVPPIQWPIEKHDLLDKN
jgi:hypothetical protein